MGIVRQMQFGAEVLSQMFSVRCSRWIYLVCRAEWMLQQRNAGDANDVQLQNCRTWQFSPSFAGANRKISNISVQCSLKEFHTLIISFLALRKVYGGRRERKAQS